MGEKFLQFLGPGSKLGRVIRQVEATATPKSRKPRETPEEKKGRAGTARGATTLRTVHPRAKTQDKPAGPPILPPVIVPTGTSHKRTHRRPQSAKARTASMKNLRKARAALGRK